MLVKTISFCLERFHRYGALKMYSFLAHPVGLRGFWYSAVFTHLLFRFICPKYVRFASTGTTSHKT